MIKIGATQNYRKVIYGGWIMIIVLESAISPLLARSISQLYRYPLFCSQASINDELFGRFRRHGECKRIVETLTKEQGQWFADDILAKYPYLMTYMSRLCEEDRVGGPLAWPYEGIGIISPTVLRYVRIVGDLQQAFGDISTLHIVEIGGGYGGQCKILHTITGFASYTIIDLPECLPLIRRYLDHFGISHVNLVSAYDVAHVDLRAYDLVISAYALSEISREEQQHYLDRIVYPTPRGYVIYNHMPAVSPLSLDEFVQAIQPVHKDVLLIRDNPAHVTDVVTWGR